MYVPLPPGVPGAHPQGQQAMAVPPGYQLVSFVQAPVQQQLAPMPTLASMIGRSAAPPQYVQVSHHHHHQHQHQAPQPHFQHHHFHHHQQAYTLVAAPPQQQAIAYPAAAHPGFAPAGFVSLAQPHGGAPTMYFTTGAPPHAVVAAMPAAAARGGPGAPPHGLVMAAGAPGGMPPSSGLQTHRTGGVEVIDPALCIGKVTIPHAKIFPTLGLHYWDCGTCRRDLSVCCLFQQGRCHAGEHCHQIHVEREFIAELRRQHAEPDCCPHCTQKPNATAWLEPLQSLRVEHDGRVYDVPRDRLLFTQGAADHIRHLRAVGAPDGAAEAVDTSMLPITALCKLFLRGKCRYAKDCKWFHVCPKFFAAPRPASVAAKAPPAVPSQSEGSLSGPLSGGGGGGSDDAFHHASLPPQFATAQSLRQQSSGSMSVDQERDAGVELSQNAAHTSLSSALGAAHRGDSSAQLSSGALLGDTN